MTTVLSVTYVAFVFSS